MKFDRLPIAYTGEGPFPTETLEALGFAIGGEIEDIFIEVTPPAGWALRATDNVLISEILDGQGAVRGSVFYKSWAWERHAFFSLLA